MKLKAIIGNIYQEFTSVPMPVAFNQVTSNDPDIIAASLFFDKENIKRIFKSLYNRDITDFIAEDKINYSGVATILMAKLFENKFVRNTLTINSIRIVNLFNDLFNFDIDKITYVLKDDPILFKKVLTFYANVNQDFDPSVFSRISIIDSPSKKNYKNEIIFVGGPPKSGKSSFAKNFYGDNDRYNVIDSDEFVVKVAHKFFPKEGDISFSQAYELLTINELWDKVDQEINKKIEESVQYSKSIVLVRTFLNKKQRDKYRNMPSLSEYNKKWIFLIPSLESTLVRNALDVDKHIEPSRLISTVFRINLPKPYEGTMRMISIDNKVNLVNGLENKQIENLKDLNK